MEYGIKLWNMALNKELLHATPGGVAEGGATRWCALLTNCVCIDEAMDCLALLANCKM